MGLVALALARDLLRKPWQLLLTILSITAGVTVVVGVDIANESALAEFRRAGDITAGQATHRLTGTTAGIPESLYRSVRVDAGIRLAAPVISAEVAMAGEPGQWTLIGVDPLSDFRLRGYRFGNGAGEESSTNAANQAWPLFVAAGLERESGDELTLESAGRRQSFNIAGELVVPGGDPGKLLVTDISWAQDFLAMQGRISHIDLRLSPDEAQRLQEMLPPEVRLIHLGVYDGAREDMSRAFRINLTALSLLALVVAMFLVYSAVSFQVARRRPLLGLLGALGVTPTGVAMLLLWELVVTGLLGTMLGIALGVFLAQYLTALVGGTIDALYHALAEPPPRLGGPTMVRALLVGVLATILSGLVPVLQASRESAVSLIRGSGESLGMGQHAGKLLPVSVVLCLPATLLLIWPGDSLVLPFAGLFLLICALSLLGPWLLRQAGNWSARHGGAGLVPKMALGNASRHLDRTGVAVVALAVAVSATLGVELMIRSFRHSVGDWLEHYLRADIYLAAEDAGDSALSENYIAALAAIPGVAQVAAGRRSTIATTSGPLTVFALDTPAEGFAGFRVIRQLEGNLRARFHEDGELLVTEPLARRLRLEPGDSITLPTDRGPRPFTVAAIYRDYSSDRGLVTMDWRTWRRHYDDHRRKSAALYLDAGVDTGDVMAKARASPGAPDALFLRANRELREASLAVFDQTFRITAVLRWLAVIVAVTGIVSALMALLLARRREFSMLTAIGFSRAQVGGLLLAEAGIAGLVAGLVAVPLGMLLSLALIRVINVRSFGWTMDILVDWELAAQSVLLALFAALVAALYPAWRMRPAEALEGLRDE